MRNRSRLVAEAVLFLLVCLTVGATLAPAGALDEICIDTDSRTESGMNVWRVKVRLNPQDPEACAEPVGITVPPVVCRTLPDRIC